MDPLDKSQSIANVPMPEIEINLDKKPKSTERTVVSPKKLKTPIMLEPMVEYRLEEYNQFDSLKSVLKDEKPEDRLQRAKEYIDHEKQRYEFIKPNQSNKSSEFKTSIDHTYVDSYPILKCGSFKLLKPESLKDISKGHMTISKNDLSLSPKQP